MKSSLRLVLLSVVCAAVTALTSGPIRAQSGPSVGAPITHQARLAEDQLALERYRPGYPFWRHIFTIADGSIVFGSARDGRLLGIVPTKGDWADEGSWSDPSLVTLIASAQFPTDLDDRRTRMAELLEPIVGPVLHNPTRGNFLTPNTRRYGAFLAEWSAIYERFGVPAEIGLAQALVESGFDGLRRSESRAIGFCQWLQSNWRQLDRLSPVVIEARNQTTQAPYCAAYLSILATKYGSFIPALSDHHSGGTNVGRIVISGRRLGGETVRDMYLLGSQFARDLRRIDLYGFRDLYRTYGPRSYSYAEMVFGNMQNVRDLIASVPQLAVYAMRTPRAFRVADIMKRTGLSREEVRRFNPALVKQVPANSDLFLPTYVSAFGPDLSFWHRPASRAYAEALADFIALSAPPEQWDDPAFLATLRSFEQRFRTTRTPEGTIMATVLAFVISDAASSGRREMLAAFESSEDIHRLFEQGLLQRVTTSLAALPCSEPTDGSTRSC